MKTMNGVIGILAATFLSCGLAEAQGVKAGHRTGPHGRHSKGIVIDPAQGPTVRIGSVDRVHGPDAHGIVVDGARRDLRIGHQEFPGGKDRWGASYGGANRDVQVGRVSKPNGVDKFGIDYDGKYRDFRFGVRWQPPPGPRRTVLRGPVPSLAPPPLQPPVRDPGKHVVQHQDGPGARA